MSLDTTPNSIIHDFRASLTPACPACNGEGFVAEDTGYTDRDGAPIEYKLTCGWCGGHGLNSLDNFDADDSGAQIHEIAPLTEADFQAAFLNVFAVL